MVSKLYTIYDRVAEDYAPPFMARNDGVALRQYNSLIQQQAVPGVDMAGDFWLFSIGSFDHSSGLISPLERPQRVYIQSEVENG